MNDALNCPNAKNGKPCICKHHKVVEYIMKKRAVDKDYEVKELFNSSTSEMERKLEEI
jgi:hypothetical protein